MFTTKPMPHASRSNSGEYNPSLIIVDSNIRRFSKKVLFSWISYGVSDDQFLKLRKNSQFFNI
jgi:hypothetical protein